MRTIDELEAEAREILRSAVRDYGPRAIFSLLSGGNDSRSVAVLVHAALADWHGYRGAALIDTGIALQEAHEATARFAAENGIQLAVERTRESYDDFVRRWGFPGAGQHYRMYQRLKERAVEALVRGAKSMRMDRVLLVTGIRQAESVRRMLLTDPIQRKGAQVWVNPLFYWTTDERDAYMETRGIARNPISGKICGTSGDCLCGAMAEEGELADLDYWFGNDPAVQRIHRLQEECAALGVPCKWGHKPNGKPARKRREGRPMFLCVGCEARTAP